MVRSAVTVCLVPEARKGPFVFHGDLPAACREARSLGFDGIEIFGPSGAAVDRPRLRELLQTHNLQLAAVGTGAGLLLHGFSLCDPAPQGRAEACAFVREMIDFGADFGAPAIIGSMQGQAGTAQGRAEALRYLEESLRHLAAHAARRSAKLLFEPLNRYETDLVRTLSEGAQLLEGVGTENLKLLADLFHMNIEETDPAQSLTQYGGAVGHVHFVDSNRRAAGFGHIDYEPIVEALVRADFAGYASAEAFPHPDSASAARRTIESFQVFRTRNHD